MRDAELFARIEYLMQTEGVYRQNDLTIERLAERLDTNRTYISRAINQQAGKAFSSYVNSYRASTRPCGVFPTSMTIRR